MQKSSPSKIYYRVLANAAVLARRAQSPVVCEEHLLAALALTRHSQSARILAAAGYREQTYRLGVFDDIGALIFFLCPGADLSPGVRAVVDDAERMPRTPPTATSADLLLVLSSRWRQARAASELPAQPPALEEFTGAKLADSASLSPISRGEKQISISSSLGILRHADLGTLIACDNYSELAPPPAHPLLSLPVLAIAAMVILTELMLYYLPHFLPKSLLFNAKPVHLVIVCLIGVIFYRCMAGGARSKQTSE